MLTYQNDPSVKDMFIARFAAHRAADEVIQGTGFTNGRGCFIGCTMNEYSHEKFSNQIAPQWLANLADTIFEGLLKREAPQFGTDLLAAIPVGKDVDSVKWDLAILRHERQFARLKDNKEDYAEECRNALKQVIDYCKLELVKDSAAELALSAASAASAAYSAAELALSAASAASAAYSAAESAARSAYSAAYSAAELALSAASAASAAYSAAYSAAESAESAAESAVKNEFRIERDNLLMLLREFKG